MRGDGSITHRGSDRYRLEFVCPRTKERHTTTVRCKTKTQANQELREFREEIMEASRRLKKISLGDAIKAYKASRDFRDKKAQHKVVAALNHLTKCKGTAIPLKHLDPIELQDYQEKRLEKVQAVTVRSELGSLSSFFKWCQIQGWIMRNPTRDMVKVKANRNTNQPYVTGDEMREVLRAVQGHETWEPYYILAWYQGWRLSTIIQFHMGMVEKLEDRWIARDVPTKTGPKTFRLHSKVREYLEAREDLEVKVARTFWDGDKPCERLVHLPVVRRKGKGFKTPRALDAARRHDVKALGLPLPLSHACRRGAASEMFKKGASLRQIGAILGHTSEQTTRQYLHGISDEGQDALELL